MTTTAPAETLVAVSTETAMGWAGVALSPRGIRYATLFHRTEAACLGELRAFGAFVAEDERTGEIVERLQRYANGDARALEGFPLDLPPGEEFQVAVWRKLLDVPPGETRSYGWVARQLGRPGAARAVGAAVGSNPVPLWLPCHRVVASDGTLHGFGGGLAMKQALLEMEGALPRRMV